MNAQLTLTILLLVVGGILSLKDDFETRAMKKERRDLLSFQSQLYAATYLDVSSCSPFPCVSALNNDWCSSFCRQNSTAYGLMVESLVSCYRDGFCGRDFQNIILNNVNISIAPGSYKGNCYLHGDQVTLSLASEYRTIQPYTAPAYRIIDSLNYVFDELTLSCQPDLPCPPCINNVGVPNCSQNAVQSVVSMCCGSDLLTKVICLVQQLVGSLGLKLNLLSCNCNCGWFLGKRQASDNTAAFDVKINVTQAESFTIFILYQGADYYATQSAVRVFTVANPESPIPSEFATDLTNGISAVFNNYRTFNTIQYNYYTIITDLMDKFHTNCQSSFTC